jgi:hypothetical protein
MTLDRRAVLRILGAAGAAASTGPEWAFAQRPPRILGGPAGPRGEWTSPGPEVRQVLGDVRVGEPHPHDNLSVLWLHGPAGPPLEVLTLDEALRQRVLTVSERPQASVPEIVVDNAGAAHVLMLAGEILVGGKQHRVLTEDILLPPKSGPRPIGVYCVEQGRWEAGRTSFGTAGALAAPGLRARLLAKTDQRRVWEEVARQAREARAASPTASYQAIYDHPEVRRYLTDAEQAFRGRFEPDALGAAVLVGGSLSGIDLFLDAGLFRREWVKLFRAHALAAYGQRPKEAPDGETLRRQVAELLRLAASVKGDLREGGGVGQLFEFDVRGGRGMALTFDRRVLHAAIT